MRKTRWVTICMLCILVGSLLNACTVDAAPNAPPEIPIDSQFKEFHELLGGRSTLGPGTFPKFEYNGLSCQYTTNALMCYDPLAADPSHRYKLYPLGLNPSLNLVDTPDAPNGAEGQVVVDGYILYSPFVPLYERLKGSEYAGRALTRARYNYLQRRIEQYFENVAFFQPLDDGGGQVCLLAYGLFGCEGRCQVPPPDPCLGMINPTPQQVEQPFMPGLIANKLLIIGQPVSRVQSGADGLPEQVYEAALVYSPDGSGANIRLRPLPLLLGIVPEELQAANGTQTDLVIFYPTQAELGYYVLRKFDSFIMDNGGYNLSGMPITRLKTLERNKMRQCFENYCLEYDPNSAEDLLVRLQPLGTEYVKKGFVDPALVAAPLYSAETIAMKVTVEKSNIPQDEGQIFHLVVTDRQSGMPMVGVTASLRLVLPDQSEKEASFLPTGEDGRSSLSLEPLPEVNNSEMIAYYACLNLSSPLPICVSSTYQVWNYR